MTNYLETTVPSDYDVGKPWYCTIGRVEYEIAAKELVRYLQAHDDEWRPVLVVHLAGSFKSRAWGRDSVTAAMTEDWLACLQQVRKERSGPIELIMSSKARGGLQLRWPSGRIEAATHHFTDEQVADLFQGLLYAHLTGR